MPKTSAARIANDSLFCEAHVAMDKIIERLLAMADEGATADEVSRLISKDGTELLRELMQGYFDRRAEQERRVEVVGADGVERRDVRTASRTIETVVGEIEVKRLLYQAPGVEGIAKLAGNLRSGGPGASMPSSFLNGGAICRPRRGSGRGHGKSVTEWLARPAATLCGFAASGCEASAAGVSQCSP